MPSDPDRTEYRADAEASSPHPQDWGRAVQLVLQELAEQAERDGRGTVAEALLGAEVRLRIEPSEEGVRIAGAWRPEAREPGA